MQVNVNIAIAHNIERVWRWAGGYDLLPVISSACFSSRLEDGGRVRVLTNNDGAMLWERLLMFDEEQKALAYLIEDTKNFQGPYDIGYIGRISLSSSATDETTFSYTGIFEPVRGASEQLAREAVEAFAHDCCLGINRVLKTSKRS